MLKEGHHAPNFTLPSNRGVDIALESLRDKKIILYFYPKDSTPGCTVEARDFETLKKDFQLCNTVVIGVSKDSISSHNRFATKENLSFDLLADESKEVCQKYGVWVEKSRYGKKYMGVNRTTFFIDEYGIIKKVWHNVSVAGHAAEVLKHIRS